MSPRDQVIKEIISTEEMFLKKLLIIDKYFAAPLKERDLLPSKIHGSIFGELKTIHCMNQELYYCLMQEEDLGKVFLLMAPFLKAYSSYANNFHTALSLLEECKSGNEELREFVEGSESRPEVSMKLGALLITPVQRIPRYRLLLEQLLHHTPPSHPHYSTIEGALEQMNLVADHMNKQLAEVENFQKLLSLQKALQCGNIDVIVPGRKLIKYGILSKVSRNGNGSQQRLFFLFSDALLYTKLPQQTIGTPTKQGEQAGKEFSFKPNSLEICQIFPLHHCKITSLFGCGKQGITFKVHCQGEELVLVDVQPSEGQVWVEELHRCVAAAIEKRKTLKRVSLAVTPKKSPFFGRIMRSSPKPITPSTAVVSSSAHLMENNLDVCKKQQKSSKHAAVPKRQWATPLVKSAKCDGHPKSPLEHLKKCTSAANAGKRKSTLGPFDLTEALSSKAAVCTTPLTINCGSGPSVFSPSIGSFHAECGSPTSVPKMELSFLSLNRSPRKWITYPNRILKPQQIILNTISPSSNSSVLPNSGSPSTSTPPGTGVMESGYSSSDCSVGNDSLLPVRSGAIQSQLRLAHSPSTSSQQFCKSMKDRTCCGQIPHPLLLRRKSVSCSPTKAVHAAWQRHVLVKSPSDRSKPFQIPSRAIESPRVFENDSKCPKSISGIFTPKKNSRYPDHSIKSATKKPRRVVL